MKEKDRISEEPPGTPKGTGIPHGLEVLLKKAAIDPAFKALLLARRAEAATTIGLILEPSEVLMLQSTTPEQLEAIIARTTVPQGHRRAFLGQAAAAMLATLGTMTFLSGCPRSWGTQPDRPKSEGIRPDHPLNKPQLDTEKAPDRPPDKHPGITQPQG